MPDTLSGRLMLNLQWGVARLSYGLTNYRHPMRLQAISASRDARRLAGVATTPLECTEIFNAVKACEKISGDIAEAGVYRGGTAAVILAASPAKHLRLFDTFEGLPQPGGGFAVGEYCGSVENVRKNLSRWVDRIEIHKGVFPESTTGLDALRFSFVHLDLDLYDSTAAAIKWFWPRINPGGILLSHDYPLVDGVVRAFHEFFDDRPEPFIALSGNQCMAVKS